MLQDIGDYLHDPFSKLDFRDLPTPDVAVNFPMELVPGSKVGHTTWNGVTRQIVRAVFNNQWLWLLLAWLLLAFAVGIANTHLWRGSLAPKRAGSQFQPKRRNQSG